VRKTEALRHILILVATLTPVAAAAQSRERVSVDSVAAVDFFEGQGASDRPDGIVDVGVVVRLSDGWLAYVRPWFFKSAQGSDWDKEIYQAALQYQRGGRVDTRVDAGYIASPIGLGMLDMRADANPTIRPHLSYFVPLMPFDRSAPSVGPIVASYPLGAQITVSTSRWDARGAVVSSAPTRRFALNADTPNPRATPVFVAGGGVTPRTGLRLGAAMAAGLYATREELKAPAALADRRLTMWSFEGEYGVGYTKVSGEVTRARFDAGAVRDTAATWFVQGTQTVSPRWFLAARHEGISAPPFGGQVTGGPRLMYKTNEVAVGYRISPELTVRSSVFASKWYTNTTYDQQAGISLVWSRRWW
jgi:hypothetical protein